MKLAHIADRVAKDVYTRPINPDISTSAVVRDAADMATGGDLSTSMLDRLCDMIEARLCNPFKYGMTGHSIRSDDFRAVIRGSMTHEEFSRKWGVAT